MRRRQGPASHSNRPPRGRSVEEFPGALINSFLIERKYPRNEILGWVGHFAGALSPSSHTRRVVTVAPPAEAVPAETARSSRWVTTPPPPVQRRPAVPAAVASTSAALAARAVSATSRRRSLPGPLHSRQRTTPSPPVATAATAPVSSAGPVVRRTSTPPSTRTWMERSSLLRTARISRRPRNDLLERLEGERRERPASAGLSRCAVSCRGSSTAGIEDVVCRWPMAKIV